jgi:4-aminobutyrate aminotransferase-like enzyme
VNDDLERVSSSIPGPRTRELATALRARESRNVTFVSDEFPVFWESAAQATVTDVDGNRYIDLTASFGVANVGYCNPRVVEAIGAQAARLMHGMGDVHPTEVRARLMERLTKIVPPGLDKIFLATTGSEAVEAALKTAMLATGKSGFVAFNGAYHGLSLGTLAVAGIPKFRDPFAANVAQGTVFLDYPTASTDIATALAGARAALKQSTDIAAVIVEPLQGRGGVLVPPAGYLEGLRRLCDERGVLLIFDEVFTGFGRTGDWFAAQHEDVTPDIMCVGKAMGGGFPISATIARAQVMDAWPASTGEALHTSTFLGNPLGCAAALATIDELERRNLPARAGELGRKLGERLMTFGSNAAVRDVRGRGLMWGVQLAGAAQAQRAVVAALAKGVIVLQAGVDGDVLSLTPPLIISERQLFRAIDILEGTIP